jgi:hypothetical protein
VLNVALLSLAEMDLGIANSAKIQRYLCVIAATGFHKLAGEFEPFAKWRFHSKSVFT